MDTVGSIARAKRIITALSEASLGASLTEIMARTEFTKSTTHRVLASLQEVHYVYQDPDSRRYHLGLALAKLARSAARSDLSALAGRPMRRLAEATGDTVFLSAPEGAVSVCIRRELGAFPIRTLWLDAGDRLPLGVGATGQALYASTPEARRRAAARANAGWMAEFGITPEKAEENCADFQRRGYALNPGQVVSGMSAVALPVVTAGGTLAAALGVGAIDDRMRVARIEGELVPLLRDETARLAERIGILEQEGLY